VIWSSRTICSEKFSVYPAQENRWEKIPYIL
jgi:hypothetical protein